MIYEISTNQYLPLPLWDKSYLLRLLLTLLQLLLELLLGFRVAALQFAVGLSAGCQLLLLAGRVVRLLHCLHLWMQSIQNKTNTGSSELGMLNAVWEANREGVAWGGVS